MSTPIKDIVHPQHRAAVTSWEGPISDHDLIPAYRALYGSSLWEPGFHELADLRQADMSDVTQLGLGRLAEFVEKSHGDFAGVVKTAVLVEADLPFGLARMYGAYAEASPETVHVFRSKADALDWLGIPDLPLT